MFGYRQRVRVIRAQNSPLKHKHPAALCFGIGVPALHVESRGDVEGRHQRVRVFGA